VPEHSGPLGNSTVLKTRKEDDVNKLFASFLLAAAVTLPAWGQKVEVQKPDRSQILQVRTALHHLTVLEMAEPVSAVAVGSPAFKVEWRENRVFIQPLEPSVATNLFVWTASARFNYELGPAGSPEEMHFAIDQPVPAPVPAVAAAPLAAPSGPTTPEVLLKTRPVRTDRVKLRNGRVGVVLTETFEHQGQLFIRFAVRNNSKKPYAVGVPQVVAVIPGRFRESLHSLTNVQLADKDAARLKTNGQVPLEVVAREIQSVTLQPGQEAVGVLGITLPETGASPLVLRVVFPPSPAGPLAATLVR
jgi:hypothetical protein